MTAHLQTIFNKFLKNIDGLFWIELTDSEGVSIIKSNVQDVDLPKSLTTGGICASFASSHQNIQKLKMGKLLSSIVYLTNPPTNVLTSIDNPKPSSSDASSSKTNQNEEKIKFAVVHINFNPVFLLAITDANSTASQKLLAYRSDIQEMIKQIKLAVESVNNEDE